MADLPLRTASPYKLHHHLSLPWSQASCLLYTGCIHGFHFSFLLPQLTHCIFVTNVLPHPYPYYWLPLRSALLRLPDYPADARLLYWYIFPNEIYPAQIYSFPVHDIQLLSTVPHRLQYIRFPNSPYHNDHKCIAAPRARDPHFVRFPHTIRQNISFRSVYAVCILLFHRIWYPHKQGSVSIFNFPKVTLR